MINEAKNQVSLTLEQDGQNKTWDEADYTWDESKGTWENQRIILDDEAKNTVTLNNL